LGRGEGQGSYAYLLQIYNSSYLYFSLWPSLMGTLAVPFLDWVGEVLFYTYADLSFTICFVTVIPNQNSIPLKPYINVKNWEYMLNPSTYQGLKITNSAKN